MQIIIIHHGLSHTTRAHNILTENKNKKTFKFWCLKYLETDKNTGDDHDHKEKPHALYRDEELIDIIDHLLQEMDKNHDGYIDYAEYRSSDARHTI